MSDTPRTVQDAYNKGIDADSTSESTVYGFLRDYGNALIGAQGRVVYTEETLLAAGIAYEDAHRAALDMNDYEAGLIAGARAAITAAGGVVADEVVEVRDYCETDISVPSSDANGDPDYIRIYGGDKLYITREETADDQG